MSLEGTDAGEGASAGRGSPTQDHPRDSPAGGIPRETSHGGATPVEQTQAARVPYVCRLSADLVRQAQQELNEKPEWRSRDIQALRDMALAHPGLKCCTDDAFLLRFLRARKFDYDRAFSLLLEYFSVRAKHEAVFKDCLPSRLQHVCNSKITMLLPHRDNQGHRLVLFRPGLWDYACYPIMDVLKLNVVQLEKAVQDEETQICGIVVICDFAGLSLAQVKNLDRDYVKLMTSMMQDAFPMRIKAVHMCNEPSIFGMAWTIIKPFIKDKIAQRIRFHGSDLTQLKVAVGLENLPCDLGGHLPPADDLAKMFYDDLERDERYFQDLLTYTLDLSLPLKQPDASDCLVGTYRRMNID